MKVETFVLKRMMEAIEGADAELDNKNLHVTGTLTIQDAEESVTLKVRWKYEKEGEYNSVFITEVE